MTILEYICMKMRPTPADVVMAEVEALPTRKRQALIAWFGHEMKLLGYKEKK